MQRRVRIAMVKVRKVYWSRFLYSIRHFKFDRSCRSRTYLEVALVLRVRVVVSPPFGSHGLELKHGKSDVRAVEIDFGC